MLKETSAKNSPQKENVKNKKQDRLNTHLKDSYTPRKDSFVRKQVMGDDQLRRCVLEELRKAQGEPLSPDELFDRCGGPKATSLNVDTFMTFIAQHCSRAVKAIHDAGDENSLPRYALHVDSARKTGTLKRRTARSHSQSSSRGATPEAAIARFNPRTDGFSIFCLVVRKLSANSLDGTVNWNVIRNQYRKETGRHLNAEELNAMCGTLNMTKYDLLSTHLSSVVQILDSRGQIVRPASPFNPKTPSPTSIGSRSSGEELSPRTDASLENQVNAAEESARRRLIVEQLRRNGVVVDDHGRAVVHEGRSPLSSQSSENSSQEADAFREFATPMSTLKDVDESVDSAEFMTPSATLAGEAMIASEIREREHSGDSADLRQTPESGQTSFVSVDQVLDTSGEGGYATGFDATPESDVSLDFSVDRSAHESTPRRHEITLCDVDDSVQETEEEVAKHESEKKIMISEDEKTAKDESQKRDTLVELAKSYQGSESGSEGSAEISIIKRVTELDERQAEPPLVANKSGGVLVSDDDDEHLAVDASPSTLCSAASYHIADIEDERDDVFDERERTIEPDYWSRHDGEPLHVPKIVIEDVSSVKEQEQSVEEEDDMKEMTEEQGHSSQEPDADRTVEVVPSVRERALSFEEGKNASGEEEHYPQEELDECFTAGEFVPTVRERMKSFEEGHEEKQHDRSVRQDPPLESIVPVKEQVEKFEHLHDDDNLNESRRSHFDEEEVVENVDVQEIVHELELSASEQHDTAGFKQHELEHFPASVHVNETVHRLEHEQGQSLPICEQFEETIHRGERRLDAGDAPALDQYSEKSETPCEQPAVEVECHIDMSRTAELTSKTVTVTFGEPAVDNDEDAPAEVCAPPPTPADTHTVVVDLNPCVEAKLPECDTWEKEFVVASGSTASEISNSLTEANMAAAHEFIREVEEKKKKISESDTTSQPAVISAEVVEELRVSEELPAMPLSLSTNQNNEENKTAVRATGRGHVLLPRRRLMDCCSIL